MCFRIWNLRFLTVYHYQVNTNLVFWTMSSTHMVGLYIETGRGITFALIYYFEVSSMCFGIWNLRFLRVYKYLVYTSLLLYYVK